MAKQSTCRCKIAAAALLTFVIGVAVLTVELVVSDPDVCSSSSVAKLDVTDAALEAAEVVEQTKTLDDHRSAAT